jgi:hypothetical protein
VSYLGFGRCLGTVFIRRLLLVLFVKNDTLLFVLWHGCLLREGTQKAAPSSLETLLPPAPGWFLRNLARTIVFCDLCGGEIKVERKHDADTNDDYRDKKLTH